MTFKPCKIKSALFTAAALVIAGTVTVFAASILGDANNDGIVSVSDATCIQKVIAEVPVNGVFSESNADADGNGIINIKDATAIQRWLAGLKVSFPIGQQTTEPATQSPTDADGWGHTVFRP